MFVAEGTSEDDLHRQTVHNQKLHNCYTGTELHSEIDGSSESDSPLSCIPHNSFIVQWTGFIQQFITQDICPDETGSRSFIQNDFESLLCESCNSIIGE